MKFDLRTRLFGSQNLVSGFTNRSVIKSIQYVTSGSMTNLATATATIVAVNPNHAVVMSLGQGAGMVNDNSRKDVAKVTLTNATTVTFDRDLLGNDACVLYGVVFEFVPGIIHRLQQASVTGTSGTATITAVDVNKTLLIPRGRTSTSASAGATSSIHGEATLTNSTTLTNEAGIAATLTTHYTVVEFF